MTQTLNRRLSAILAADIVGYSRLMAQDEAGTLAAVNAHHASDFDPLVASHNGRIVKLMGDGTLVEFASVADAVMCARDVQAAVAANPDLGLTLRIGINLGDIILQDDDIFGDGVNIAARLEALAKPGGICISSVVHESVGGRLPMRFDDGGTVQVKNIDRPLRVWHWHPDQDETAADPPAPAKPAAQTPRAAIAVLPFDNMSGDADQTYFSDGISEDIITDLSKVHGLTVIARNSSFAYRGASVDLRKVGRELGVSHVLEGSVRRAAGRVRISAQLIDAADGAHLWADRYDRDLTDIFAVQDEVTLEIVNALKIHLSPEERVNITDTGTTNLSAHEDFMRMRGAIMFPGTDSKMWHSVIDHGLAAIKKDPGFADAYAVMALHHLLDMHNNWSGRGPEDALAEADRLVGQALALAPDRRWPVQCKAAVQRFQGDLVAAKKNISRVLKTFPSDALALFSSGGINLSLGLFEETIADMEAAIRVDPALRHQCLQFQGMAHLLLGNHETAALLLRERIHLVPNTDIGRAWLAAALGHLGEGAAARAFWDEMLALVPEFDFPARLTRWNYADKGHVQHVLKGLELAGITAQG